MIGKGLLKFSNGDIYEGYFANDKLNGYGTITHKDGTTKSGHWKDGDFVG